MFIVPTLAAIFPERISRHTVADLTTARGYALAILRAQLGE